MNKLSKAQSEFRSEIQEGSSRISMENQKKIDDVPSKEGFINKCVRPNRLSLRDKPITE